MYLLLLANNSELFLFDCLIKIFLGLIQGLTEFLPISSTAHLKIIPLIFGLEDPGFSVSAILQLGSILAVIFYFKSEILIILRGLKKTFRYKNPSLDFDTRLGAAVLIGTLPIVVVGFLIKTYWVGYEDSVIRSTTSIAYVSIIMATLLGCAEKFGSKLKYLQKIVPIDGLFIGLAQILSFFPGASRSGVTLTAALFTGWERESAARFSFLLGIPSITLAGLVELNSFSINYSLGEIFSLVLGLLSSFISSWYAIDLFLKFLKTNNTWIFISYRIIFGFSLLAFLHLA